MADFSDTTPNDPFINNHGYGVVPPSSAFQDDWPATGNITQGVNGGLSMAGWTEGNEGFIQQSFLGASIRSFNISAGFGGTSSTMNIDLVNDEYHKSDGSPIGLGDDVYHGGEYDHFNPPVVGSPVFFKFGKNHASVEQAFRQTFDDTYNYQTMPQVPDFPESNLPTPIENHPQGHYLSSDTRIDELDDAANAKWIDKTELLNDTNHSRGKYHFVFGGILQSYTQNKSSAGNPLYNAKLIDPREILQNATVLLNNYQGTTFNNKNLFNVYGFLEYDPSDTLQADLDSLCVSKEVLTKVGSSYVNSDVYRFGTSIYVPSAGIVGMEGVNIFPPLPVIAPVFPITGQGFSRRSANGIPWYRVSQALSAMFQERGYLPKEYRDAGFGGTIDFRGYQYIVDFSGLPLDKIPNMYYLDFDKLDLLSLAQEICDVISHDLFVSLLPVIDHPACEFLYDYNKAVWGETRDPSKMIAGIIRVDAIDRTQQPDYGVIKEKIEELASHGLHVENQDVGFEVSNVTTDKFVAGAQEVEMYYFHTNKDRDDLQEKRKQAGINNGKYNLEILEQEQWSLATSLKQQVLPFYGFLGGKAVTIPRGFGSYQQIMLDATHVDAHGVGSYYIATEIELRAALVSFEQWSNFLLYYNERYIEELSQYQALYGSLTSSMTKVIEGINDQLPDGMEGFDLKTLLYQLIEAGREFGVCAPRCVFNSDKPNCDYDKRSHVKDGYPASPCSPPFGYPLYYKRAEKIGLPRAGMASIHSEFNTALSNLERIQDRLDEDGPAARAKVDDFAKNLFKIEELIRYKKTEAASVGPGEAQTQLAAEINDLVQKKDKIRQAIVQIQKDLDTIVATGKAMKLSIRNKLQGSKRLIKNMPHTSKEGLKNAKKVYAFVKKVADECLGKKFLVKIPKVANLTYGDDLTLHPEGGGAVFNVRSGPFGFKPLPVSTDPSYAGSSAFVGLISNVGGFIRSKNLFEHYLDIDQLYGGTFPNGYSYGALKCNFNPIAEKWEYNYMPEPQGGYPSYEQFGKSQSQLLSPQFMTKLITDNNRTSCYVRFDHSQFLDFHNISSDKIEQQSIGGRGQFVPDLMETLPNLNPDRSESLNKIQARLQNDKDLQRQGPSVAFVKCTIDDEFYMAPRVIKRETLVFARAYTVNIPPPDFDTVDTEYGDDGGYRWDCSGPEGDCFATIGGQYATRNECLDNSECGTTGKGGGDGGGGPTADPPSPEKKYSCNNYFDIAVCEADEDGEYDDYDDCVASCEDQTKPPWGWECKDPAIGGCDPKKDGTYASYEDCFNQCRDDGGGGDPEDPPEEPAGPRYSCDSYKVGSQTYLQCAETTDGYYASFEECEANCDDGSGGGDVGFDETGERAVGDGKILGDTLLSSHDEDNNREPDDSGGDPTWTWYCTSSNICIETSADVDGYDSKEECEANCEGGGSEATFGRDGLVGGKDLGDTLLADEDPADEDLPKFECLDRATKKCEPTANGTFDSLAECEEGCAGYMCKQLSGEDGYYWGCVIDPGGDGDYVTLADCEASCSNDDDDGDDGGDGDPEDPEDPDEDYRWDCSGPEGDCVAIIGGEYATRDECLENSECGTGEGRKDAGCGTKGEVMRRLIPSFGVPLGGGASGRGGTKRIYNTDFARTYSSTQNGNIVLTEDYQLDPNHVYAIVTVPGRAIPSVDSRYKDSVNKAFNAPRIDEILTASVVKIAAFDEPAFQTFDPKEIDCNGPVKGNDGGGVKNPKDVIQFSFEEISKALQVYREQIKGVTLSSPEGYLSFTAPSPVYPDLVALPLMSMERCYGPWLSASNLDSTRIKYSDIGGKVEFDKDENLAPWNFAGYQLMDQAGQIKAQFSNSLLLFSERGGFVYPGAPTGVSIAKALKNGGPLVTSIDVSVNNSVKTTIKMDLYTAKFGKLQRQQEDAINQVAREKQKIIDQRNNAIRRGLAKGQANHNLMGGILKNGGQDIIDAARIGTEYYTALEKGDTKTLDAITFSLLKDSDGRIGYESTVTNQEDINEKLNLFHASATAYKKWAETAGATWNDLLVPFSNDVYSYIFPSHRPGDQGDMDAHTGNDQ